MQERGHLVVGHLAARVAEHELGHLVGGELAAVALALDQLGRRGSRLLRHEDARSERARRAAPRARAASAARIGSIASTYARAASRSGKSTVPLASRRSTRAKCRRRISLAVLGREASLADALAADELAELARGGRALFVTATSRPPGRSTRASSASPDRDRARGRASTPPRRSRTRRPRTAAPGRRRRRRRCRAPRVSSTMRSDWSTPTTSAPSSRAIRSASSPRPQPTSSTRRGAPRRPLRSERDGVRALGPAIDGRGPRAALVRVLARTTTGSSKRHIEIGLGSTNGWPGMPRFGALPPSHVFTVAPTSANSPSCRRPAAFLPST